MDSFALDPATKPDRLLLLLRSLPAGLSEWAVHPAVGEGRVVGEEGIVVIDHRGLQRVWRVVHASSGV